MSAVEIIFWKIPKNSKQWVTLAKAQRKRFVSYPRQNGAKGQFEREMLLPSSFHEKRPSMKKTREPKTLFFVGQFVLTAASEFPDILPQRRKKTVQKSHLSDFLYLKTPFGNSEIEGTRKSTKRYLLFIWNDCWDHQKLENYWVACLKMEQFCIHDHGSWNPEKSQKWMLKFGTYISTPSFG